MVDLAESLRTAERRLQAAQLASDVTALDALLDGELLFTGPDGSLFTKEDDLTGHRTGWQVMHTLEEVDLRVRVVGSTGVTWVLTTMSGTLGEQPFAGRMRYTRTWTHDAEAGWTVIAAQATVAAVPPPAP